MDFRLTTPVLAQNCWPALPQTLLNEIFSKTRGELEDLTGIIASSSTPDPADQDKGWIKLDGSGNPTGLFKYANGYWLWPHPVTPYPSGFRQIWLGNPADIPTLDGGTAGITTLYTGPFWEIDTAFAGRSPMGVGDIPDANPAHAISSGDEYGEGSHLQLADEVGLHDHPLASESTIENTDGSIKVVNSGSGGAGLLIGASGPSTDPLSVEGNEYTATQERMNVIHPVLGAYFLKRTIRQFFTG